MILRIIEIRKALHDLLLSVHPEVYYEKAPDSALYPYVVYNVSDSTDDGSLERIMLDVDIWDTPENGITIELETVAGEVDNVLHRYTFQNEGVFFSIYRENRRNIEDSDARIRRRQNEYQIRVMGVNN